jgi:hypothetical protein
MRCREDMLYTDESRIALFALHRDAHSDAPQVAQSDCVFSAEAHAAYLCETPEQIFERVRGHLILPYPEHDGWSEGKEWRDGRDAEDLVSSDFQTSLEAGWDKEYESLVEGRDKGQQLPAGEKGASTVRWPTFGRTHKRQRLRLAVEVPYLFPSSLFPVQLIPLFTAIKATRVLCPLGTVRTAQQRPKASSSSLSVRRNSTRDTMY